MQGFLIFCIILADSIKKGRYEKTLLDTFDGCSNFIM